MKNTVKYLAVLVVALTVSSALFAAQGGNSTNCSTTPSTEGATWGIAGHSVSSDAVNTSSSCKGSTAGSPKVEGGNDQQHGLAHAFGKLINTIGATIDTAIWGFTPPPPR